LKNHCIINILTSKRSKNNVCNINCSGFTITELLVAIVIFGILLWFIVPETTYSPYSKLEQSKMNLHDIKKSIDLYYNDFGRYPQNLIDLTKTKHPYLKKIPIDPFTGAEDWEVAELSGTQKTWYRTSKINYPNAPAMWNPGPESSIFNIRPRSSNNK